MPGNDKLRRGLPSWRIFTYVIIVFNLLMPAWVIAGLVSSGSGCGVLHSALCTASTGASTGFGREVAVCVIVAMWAVGNLILGGLWIATNDVGLRPCPLCDKPIKDTMYRCSECRRGFRIDRQSAWGWYEHPRGHA
jgi:hypothetical protein